MKNSEKLHIEAQKEDNDLAYLGKMQQVLREKRLEKWDDWKDKILLSPFVIGYEENISQGKITMTISTDKLEEQTIDFFPKANKVLIRKRNEWNKMGLKWLITNLIPKEDEKEKFTLPRA